MAATAILVALGAGPVRADDEAVAAYRELVDDGAALFHKGDFDGAREIFRRAYRIHRDPVLLFNIASTYRREGRYEQAIRLYERFLESAVDGDQRIDLARETITHLELLIAEREQQVAAERKAERARRDQRAAERAAEQAERKRRAAEQAPASVVELEPEPARAKRSSATLKWGGAITAGAGVIALGLAFGDLQASRDAADDLSSLPPGTPWTIERERQYDEGRSRRARAIGLALGGSALAAAGVVLYVAGSRRGDAEPRPRSVAVSPLVGAESVGAVIRGSF